MSVLVDAHGHLHPCFAEEEFFEAARANFRAARQRLSLPTETPAMLLLAECSGQAVFTRLQERAASREDDEWTMRRTDESDSLVACRSGVDEIILVAGRQIATRERLEVLALGGCRQIPDGLSIDETLERVWRDEALAIVPWGFGKWWLGRGRVLAEVLERGAGLPLGDRLFLGDNGGRPRLATPPRHFDLAKRQGIRILPGSDPLPFPGQARRAGSYGFVLPGEIDLRTPVAKLKEMLRDAAARPVPYGARARLWPFIRDQVAMQLRNRAHASGSMGRVY